MKKTFNILFTCLSLLLLISCNNGFESVFSESADERVKKVIEEYRSTLLSAPNGWKATMISGFGGGYMFYFDFKEDGTVTMISDFSDSTAENVVTGTYLMKALQRPTLSFDTYSYVHLLADPDGSINGGPIGVGLGTDFEFAFDNVGTDTIYLEGIQRNTKFTFIQATASEKTEFLNDGVKQSRVNALNYLGSNGYSFVNGSGGEIIPVGFNPSTKIFSLIYIDGNSQVQKISVPFTFSPDGILLQQPVSIAGLSFQKLFWDELMQAYYILKGTQKIFLQGSSSPIILTTIEPPILDALGAQYSSITIDPSIISGISQEFNDIFNDAAAMMDNDFGVTLNTIVITFSQSDQGTIDQAIFAYTFLFQGAELSANLLYNVDISVDNTVSFVFVSKDNNATILEDPLVPLTDYFENHTFELQYVADASLGALLGGMYPQETPTATTYGILE